MNFDCMFGQGMLGQMTYGEIRFFLRRVRHRNPGAYTRIRAKQGKHGKATTAISAPLVYASVRSSKLPSSGPRWVAGKRRHERDIFCVFMFCVCLCVCVFFPFKPNIERLLLPRLLFDLFCQKP